MYQIPRERERSDASVWQPQQTQFSQHTHTHTQSTHTQSTHTEHTHRAHTQSTHTHIYTHIHTHTHTHPHTNTRAAHQAVAAHTTRSLAFHCAAHTQQQATPRSHTINSQARCVCCAVCVCRLLRVSPPIHYVAFLCGLVV